MAGGALSFREDPFRLTPDRRYIFETDGFRRAFAMLLAGIRARRGAMLLTGPSGTGKTTLLQGLMAKLQQDGIVVFWRFHPDIPGYDVIGSCLVDLDIKDAPADPAARGETLAKALKARTPSLPGVLIVDEAGQFADAQIAEIAALPATTKGAVQVILAGLPMVADRLNGEGLAAANQAIAMRAEIGPLGHGELGAYIAHRCRVAGQAGPLVFEPAAIGRVFDHTGGTPRLVNRLCATSLFFAEPGAKQISAAVVDEAARACEGDSSAGTPNLPDADSHPDAAEPAPERPSARAEASEVHRTLAEAERAWIVGAGTQATAPATAPAAEPHVEPAAPVPVAIKETPSAPQKPAVLLLDQEAAPAAIAPPPRRSPALRIAASVVVVAGSGAVLAALLWPNGIGHDYLANSAPAKAVTHLLAAEEAKTSTAPAAVVAEAAVPPEPAPVTAPAAPEPAKTEPVIATVAPPVTEPIVAAPDPAITQPEAVVAKPEPAPIKQARAATKHDPVRPEPVAAKIEPSPEPPPAQPEPIAETPAPAPMTVMAAEPAPAAPTTEPAAAAEPVAPAPEPAPPEAVATTLSALEPANGQAPQDAKIEEPPAPAAASEPPAMVAAVVPSSEPTPAPIAKPEPAVTMEPPVVAAIVSPPAPAPTRIAQASAPAANPTELQQLMARGDEMMRLGDPASARLFYERAAARGFARAYTAVGRTYDPLALQRLSVRGGGANGEQALAWYRRGSEAGDKDAEKATGDLKAWLARPR